MNIIILLRILPLDFPNLKFRGKIQRDSFEDIAANNRIGSPVVVKHAISSRAVGVFNGEHIGYPQHVVEKHPSRAIFSSFLLSATFVGFVEPALFEDKIVLR